MKQKLIVSILIISMMFLQINSTVFADEHGKPYLSQVEVDIIANENHEYIVSQDITISDIELLEGNEIEHTQSHINQVEINNLSFYAENQELNYTESESDSLTRLNVEVPEGHEGDFNYQVSYEAQLSSSEFTVPLFVPEFASLGEGNIVEINYEAPEGKVIQDNSFPVVKGDVGSTDTSYLMNLPSHVKYVTDDSKNYFNSFNLVGWGSLITFLIIVFVWVRSERKFQKGEV